MAPLDDRKGVWKSGKGKGRVTPKGRQFDDAALAEVRDLLGDRPRRRDLLIEFLHLIQDRYHGLSAAHLRALAEEMRLSQAEVYEVATFYAHFDVVKEGEEMPPALTIRVCDSLSCELAGAQELMAELSAQYNGGREVRVVRAPCMGRCDTAPTLELGHNHIDHATAEKVAGAIAADDTHAHLPDYMALDAYRAAGGYDQLLALREGSRTPDDVQEDVLSSGLRGMGGAGFPSGRKWSFVRAAEG
ncbi:MAG: NAD(P)H-dependent oxidoreductase subunit E, partial [Pseudomonadota bacterium]